MSASVREMRRRPPGSCLNVPVAATEVVGPEPTPPITTAEEKESQVASLTGMRGFAALSVVLIHTSGKTEYTWLGVHGYGPIALFVLSGFLLYRPFARWTLGVSGRPGLRSFAIRRGARIFPAYWAVFLVWVFVYPPAVPDGFVDWLKAFSLLSSMRYFELTPGLEQTWSLGTELTWYIALPFLAAGIFALVNHLRPKIGLRVHVLLLLASVPITQAWVVYVQTQELVDEIMWLPRFLMCFALGGLVSLMMEAERAGISDISRGRRLMSDPFLLPGVALIFVLLNTSELAGPDDYVPLTLQEDLVRTTAAMGLALSLLVISIFSGPRAPVVRLMSSRFMQAAGRWSYGVYLWHLPVIVLLTEDHQFSTGWGGLVTMLTLVTTISMALGAATYAWVEVPTMAWSKRQSARFAPSRERTSPTSQATSAPTSTTSQSEAPVAAAPSKDDRGE